MPERQTLQRAERDKRQGKAPTTQAGEFVREEIHHVRAGKHGARSPQQAIAIGLSKARRAGVDLKPPSSERASERTVRRGERDYGRGHGEPSRRRSASKQALEREGRQSGSSRALAAQGRSAARRRSGSSRSQAAKKAARTKGPARRSAAAKKAARTRALQGAVRPGAGSARAQSRPLHM